MGIERVGKDKTIPKLGFFLFGDIVTNSEKKKNGSTSSKASHLINVESKEAIGTKEKDASSNNSKREVNKVTAL